MKLLQQWLYNQYGTTEAHLTMSHHLPVSSETPTSIPPTTADLSEYTDCVQCRLPPFIHLLHVCSPHLDHCSEVNTFAVDRQHTSVIEKRDRVDVSEKLVSSLRRKPSLTSACRPAHLSNMTLHGRHTGIWLCFFVLMVYELMMCAEFYAIGCAESCRSSMTLAVLLLCTLRY